MRKRIKSLLQNILEVEDLILETPKNRDFGHFATPIALQLAKTLKKNPLEIAKQIIPKLENLEIFSKVENINGYINLTLSPHFLDLQADTFLNKSLESNLRVCSLKDSKILLEYVSANPTGPLHIGHARGAIFGDTLMRLGRYLGYDITTEYYINDAGSQIQTLGLSILLAGKEYLLNEEVEYPEQYYKGEYIIDIAKSAMEKFGPEIFHNNEVDKLSDYGKDLMLEEIKDNLKSIGITFDSFISEKDLYSQWNKTLDMLKNRNAIYEKDGKIWLKSQEFGDEKDRVIIRENGEPTYLAGDIIYHYQKFQRNFEHYINIWGADHHGYIQRIKASIEHLGYDSKHLEVILAQMVSLLKNGEPYKMSKRAGNFILLRDVVDDIGIDALRFIFLSRRLDSMLEFDTSDLEKQDSSNPIFYINYANSRIHTLLSKSKQSDHISCLERLDLTLNKDALDLLFLAMQLDYVIESAFNERALQKLCDYLKELSAGFHKFYNAHKILDTPNEAELLKIMRVVSHSITLGLNLLGIQARTKM